MPEIRSHLSQEVHRDLKIEAASKGMHLKQMIAQILESHTRDKVGFFKNNQERGKKDR